MTTFTLIGLYWFTLYFGALNLILRCLVNTVSCPLAFVLVTTKL